MFFRLVAKYPKWLQSDRKGLNKHSYQNTLREAKMLIEKVRKVTIRRCGNGHFDWFKPRSGYCITCGMKIHKIKEDMHYKVCDHCGKEIDTFMPPWPALFCPHCGSATGEHLEKE